MPFVTFDVVPRGHNSWFFRAFHGSGNKEVLMVLFIRRHLLTFISFSCGAELEAHLNA